MAWGIDTKENVYILTEKIVVSNKEHLIDLACLWINGTICLSIKMPAEINV